jgi:hypothetical protein
LFRDEIKKNQENQENDSKQNKLQLKEWEPNLIKKNNQMIKDKIENKIKFEIINVIKTIAIRRKETE